MTELNTVHQYKYDPHEDMGNVTMLALRARQLGGMTVNTIGRLRVPDTLDQTHYEPLVRTMEQQTGGIIAEIIPFHVHASDDVYGIRPAEGASRPNSPDQGVWVSYETAGFDSGKEYQKPSKISDEAYWDYLYLMQGLKPTDPHSMTAENWSVCIIKPDAKEFKLEGEVYERIAAAGLGVMATHKSLQLPESQLDQIWPTVDNHGRPLPVSPWWKATVDYMTSGSVDALLIQGEDASRKMKAIKQEMRINAYGRGYQDDIKLPVADRVKSIIHTSDCDPELNLNALGFWKPHDLGRIVTSSMLARSA